jgi:hypothetical protein
MEGFRMDLDTAEEFFKRCTEREAVTETERIAILRELVQELRAIKLNETDMQRQLRGKKVLRIKKEPK